MQDKAIREIMLDQFPTTKDFKSSQRLRRNLVLGLLIVSVCVVIGAMAVSAFLLPQSDPLKIVVGGAVIIACLALTVVICFQPRIGIYTLLVGSLLFPATSGVGMPTMPMSFVPLWWNWSTIGYSYFGTAAFTGLAFSPAEVIIVLTFAVWFSRTVAMRQMQWKSGAFFWPILAYMTMVGVGFVNGLTHGANSTMALYEVRGQAYFFLTYLMAVNFITNRRHLTTIVWIIVICNCLQGLFGTITYMVLHDTITVDGFMAHDESLILNLVFLVAIMAGSLGVERRLKWAALASSPLALVAVLGNQRRASIAAFIIAFLPLMPMLWTLLKDKRNQIGKSTIIFAVLAALYLPLAWNSSGPWALPARAIRSQTDPDQRDAASNVYRSSEEYDVTFTRDVSPIFGYGYGKPFLQPVPLPQVSTDFVYYMPHNSVLWVWMRIGHIGFFLFWFMIAVFLIRGLELLKQVRAPETRLVGLLAILMLLMMLTFGKYDLALVDLRILTIAAVLLGALAMLPTIDKPTETDNGENASSHMEEPDEDEFLTNDQLAHVRPGGAIPF